MAFAKSYDELGEHFRHTRHAAMGWARRKTFPKKTKRGWNLKTVDDWLKKNYLGPYRANQTKTPNGEHSELLEARTRKTSHAAEREAIALEKERIELEEKKKNILMADDVLSLHKRVASQCVTIVSQQADMVERRVKDHVDSDTLQLVRTEVAQSGQDLLAAIEELIQAEN